MFHVVKIIDFLFELTDDYRSFGQKCLRGDLLQLLILDFA